MSYTSRRVYGRDRDGNLRPKYVRSLGKNDLASARDVESNDKGLLHVTMGNGSVVTVDDTAAIRAQLAERGLHL